MYCHLCKKVMRVNMNVFSFAWESVEFRVINLSWSLGLQQHPEFLSSYLGQHCLCWSQERT
jgi:hypothetical protein